jgi:hypothetical protein
MKHAVAPKVDRAQRWHRLRCAASWFALGLLGLAATSVALAVTRGTSAQGRPWVSGGVGIEEVSALEARRADYSLGLVTAVKRSGAFLADVRVRINDTAGRTVFDGLLDGPWLYIDLAPGRYTVQASFGAETQKVATTIHAGAHRHLALYFDVADPLAPERKPEDK